MPLRPAPPAFLDYTPVALEFGTSGLRGLVKDITDLEAYINVKGTLRYLQDIGDVREGGKVVIAGDLRPSTDRISMAAARAIRDSGCPVENAGKIPTPALMYRSLLTRSAGVMVTGSHIPFDRNGIKINKSSGEILKSDEPFISSKIEAVRAEEYARTADQSAFDARGMLKEPHPLPPVDPSAEEGYVRRYLDGFPASGLTGLRVVVYQHSAVGRDILPRILRELGAEVIPSGRTETFMALDTENVTDEQLGRLEELTLEAEAAGAPVHAVVSTDGDSDRPLVVAVRPRGVPGSRRVRFLPGDLVGIVVAEYLSADAVAVPVSANDAVERRMRERGTRLSKTKIGSPYVVAALDELARGGHSRIVGWEANGGFLIGSDIAIAARPLTALPTRDAILPILSNLFAAAPRGFDLDALWGALPARFGRSGLIDNVPTATSRRAVSRLTPPGGAAEVEFDGASAAEGAHEEIRSLLSRVFVPALGFGRIVRLNVVDGVRVYFDNGDVAHVRPSGNAPQLRIYSNSDTQARADRIVEEGLREPDGLLRELIRLAGW